MENILSQLKEILEIEWPVEPVYDDGHGYYFVLCADNRDKVITYVEKAITKIQQLQAELDKYRWIPVEEGLPKKTGSYLVLPYHKHCPTLWYQKGWYWYNAFDDCVESELPNNEPLPKVTHYRPIILPPEQALNAGQEGKD